MSSYAPSRLSVVASHPIRTLSSTLFVATYRRLPSSSKQDWFGKSCWRVPRNAFSVLRIYDMATLVLTDVFQRDRFPFAQRAFSPKLGNWMKQVCMKRLFVGDVSEAMSCTKTSFWKRRCICQSGRTANLLYMISILSELKKGVQKSLIAEIVTLFAMELLTAHEKYPAQCRMQCTTN